MSVDDLISRIHAEVERRRADAPLAAAPANPPASGPPLLRLQPEFQPRADGAYALHELLDFHDEAFVRNAYRALLGRPADPQGLRQRLSELRSGRASKVDLLGRLRFSREGRTRGVRVRGLLPRFLLARAGRVPVLGYPLRWLVCWVGLPRSARHRAVFENHAFYLMEALAGQINAGLATLRAQVDVVRADAGQIHAGLATLHAQGDAVRADVDAVRAAASALRSGIDDGLASESSARRTEVARHEDSLAALAKSLEAQDSRALELDRRGERLEGELRGRFAELSSAIDAERGFARDLARWLESISNRTTPLEAQVAVEKSAREALGGALAARLGELESGAAAQLASLGDELRAEVRQRTEFEQRVDAAERRLERLRLETSQAHARVGLLLEEARRRLPEPFDDEQLARLTEESRHAFDALYVAFEDQFRGTHDDVKQRLAVYVPIVEAAHAGRAAAPVLDLACGRGEWLELLRERELSARGVELNRVLVETCRQSDLDVVEADLIEHLRKLPRGSVGAVTGFHIIEHLPLERLVQLLDETARVLAQGGVAIFETPNPANLTVAAHTFYLDPTHQRPLPSQMMRFLVEARGLVRVEVRELNPSPRSERIRRDDAVARRLNEVLYGPRDYAVIGYKP